MTFFQMHGQEVFKFKQFLIVNTSVIFCEFVNGSEEPSV